MSLLSLLRPRHDEGLQAAQDLIRAKAATSPTEVVTRLFAMYDARQITENQLWDLLAKLPAR